MAMANSKIPANRFAIDRVGAIKAVNANSDTMQKLQTERKSKKMKKALDYANNENIPYVLILGEDELTNNCITLKDMNNKTQEQINLDNLAEKIKKLV